MSIIRLLVNRHLVWLTQMEENERLLAIGSAGNTWNPCLLALRAKGYTLKFWFTKSSEKDYQQHINAEKDGRFFCATDPAELLGLVAMWEIRGDNWKTKPGEPDIYDELYPESITYDPEGNILEKGDTTLSSGELP